MDLLQAPGNQSQEKPVHVPPPMMEAVITVPAKKLPSQTVNNLEEVAAATPLSGNCLKIEIGIVSTLYCLLSWLVLLPLSCKCSY